MRMLMLGTLFILQHIAAANGRRKIIDPIAGLIPVNPRIQKTSGNGGSDVSRSETATDEMVGKTQESGANKRDAIVNASPWYREDSIRSEEQDGSRNESNDDEQCSYTFVVSKSSQQCACITTERLESEKLIVGLHGEVLVAKSQIEDIRNEILEEKEWLPKRSEIENLQDSVSILQQESRNMDSRVSQLYMQLLHEIINKRDNTLEIQELEKKLLNRTVEMFELKEDYERLKQDHYVLQSHVNSQSEELVDLRRQIRIITEPQGSPKVRAITEVTTSDRVQTLTTLTTVRMEQATESSDTRTPATKPPTRRYQNCVEIERAGYTKSGIFNLRLPGYHRKIRVWCDFEQDPGGWIVIQRRSGKRINFYRDMAAYKRGFGRPHGDFWLGLENIHRLTNQTGVNYKLNVDMEDWNGKKTFVEYKSFRVEGEETSYRLKINHYSGTAGDSLTWHNNMRFTTMDEDNDLFGRNCAEIHHGGWWYNSCAHSNLNGIYHRGGHYRNRFQDGVYWSDWRGGSYSLKKVAMKIRPTE